MKFHYVIINYMLNINKAHRWNETLVRGLLRS